VWTVFVYLSLSLSYPRHQFIWIASREFSSYSFIPVEASFPLWKWQIYNKCTLKFSISNLEITTGALLGYYGWGGGGGGLLPDQKGFFSQNFGLARGGGKKFADFSFANKLPKFVQFSVIFVKCLAELHIFCPTSISLKLPKLPQKTTILQH
jgi:hypothetical protein